MFFFNAISSCNVLFDCMMMLHSSFLHLLQIKVFLFIATSSCNVLCDLVAFFFSTSTINYSVFVFGTMNWFPRSIAKIDLN